MVLNSPHRILKCFPKNGTLSISYPVHTMLDRTEKLRRQSTQPNQSSRKLSSTTRIPTSLSSTGGILQPKTSTPRQYRIWWEEDQDSPPNFSKNNETQTSQGHWGTRSKPMKELKQGDIVRMKEDPRNPKMVWNMPQGSRARTLWSIVFGKKRYTRNRKDKDTQVCPGVDPDEPPLSDDQTQRVIEPVLQGTSLPEDTAPGRLETPQRPQSWQPPANWIERRYIRGRIIKTSIRFKGYFQPWGIQSSRSVSLLYLHFMLVWT